MQTRAIRFPLCLPYISSSGGSASAMDPVGIRRSHHLAFRVDDITAAEAALVARGEHFGRAEVRPLLPLSPFTPSRHRVLFRGNCKKDWDLPYDFDYF